MNLFLTLSGIGLLILSVCAGIALIMRAWPREFFEVPVWDDDEDDAK